MEDKEDDVVENEELIGLARQENVKDIQTVEAAQRTDKLHMGFNLELIEKEEELFSLRKIIPASDWQILCYLRSYVTTPCKVEVLCMQNANFNVFLWAYIMDVLLRSLPSYYLYIFLGSYAPDHHLFLSKMTPLCYGFNYMFMMAGVLDLLVVNDFCTILMNYIASALSYPNPWAKCWYENKIVTLPNGTDVTMFCFNMSSFRDKVKDHEPGLLKPFGYKIGNESFQLAEILFFQDQWHKHTDGVFEWPDCFSLIFWLSVVLFNLKLYDYRLWRALQISQWILLAVYVHMSVYLFYGTIVLKIKKFSSNDRIERALQEACHINSISMLSAFVSAPPLLHLLSARRPKDPKPSRDSAVVTLSNAIYFIFRGVITDRLRVFCNGLLGVPVYAAANNHFSLFYMLTIFFSTLTMGNLFTIVTFVIILVNEFLTWIITIQCLVEVFVCQWSKLRRLSVTLAISMLGCIINIFSNDDVISD